VGRLRPYSQISPFYTNSPYSSSLSLFLSGPVFFLSPFVPFLLLPIHRCLSLSLSLTNTHTLSLSLLFSSSSSPPPLFISLTPSLFCYLPILYPPLLLSFFLFVSLSFINFSFHCFHYLHLSLSLSRSLCFPRSHFTSPPFFPVSLLSVSLSLCLSNSLSRFTFV
jgi:hypothetical protein